jgi:hypothetical protein
MHSLRLISIFVRGARQSITKVLAGCLICLSLSNTWAQDKSDQIFIPRDVIVDKIRGGMLGQMLGNLNGLPHELEYFDEPGNVTNYVPSLPDGAWTDDDTDFEWVYVVEMQKSRRVLLTHEEIFSFWKERINKRIWCSNLYARCLMDLGIRPPFTGNGILNPWANFNISGQFLSETFGLIAPAMPQTAARIGLNYTTVAIGNEPAQSTQLFTAMVSTAFVEKDINRILDAGIAALDERSLLRKVVSDVRQWHRTHPQDWRETRRLLKEKYIVENGNIRATNGFELNTGSIIAALLYGEGDFSESLKHAFNFGWDADCNAATVGTIVGVIHGYKKMMNKNDPYQPNWNIVDRYRNVTRDNMPMDETITSFADRVVDLFEVVNLENGGKVVVQENIPGYLIPVEKPRPIRTMDPISVQRDALVNELESVMIEDLTSGDRERMARSAYIAVCLDQHETLKKRFPRQWKESMYHLSGYWRVMYNIFATGHNFQDLQNLRAKFKAAGIVPNVKPFTLEEVWNGRELWKEPSQVFVTTK